MSQQQYPLLKDGWTYRILISCGWDTKVSLAVRPIPFHSMNALDILLVIGRVWGCEDVGYEITPGR